MLDTLKLKLGQWVLNLIVVLSAVLGIALALRLASYEDVSWVWALIAAWLACWQIYLRERI